jgi:hypothetical protein
MALVGPMEPIVMVGGSVIFLVRPARVSSGSAPFKFAGRPFVVSAGEGNPYNRSLSCLRQRSTGGHHSPRKNKYAAPQVNWVFCRPELPMTSGQVWAGDAPETESTVSTAPGTFATASDPPSANRIR